jgi:rare lipoprotein A (peptidoglycan hydrolase)
MTISRRFISTISAVACLMILGCGAAPRFTEKGTRDRDESSRPREIARVKEEQPARVAPSSKVLLTLEGVVSYYAHDFQGKLTSNGETFNMNDLTAAHRTFPFGTKVRVTNLENDKSVIVRVNDRGPFVEGRIMDLSMGAAKEIGLIKNGTTQARLEVLQWGDGQ